MHKTSEAQCMRETSFRIYNTSRNKSLRIIKEVEILKGGSKF